MGTWIKEGWRSERNPFVQIFLNKERGIAIMIFWTRMRVASLNKKEVAIFEKMMDSPNLQVMEAFLFLHGDMKIPI